MTLSNATTIMSNVILKVLPRLFKDVLLLVETEKVNRKIPKMMQALSQAARSPEPHFKIMTVERYLTYLIKLQESQDPITIHSTSSASGNRRNGLGYGFNKSFVLQRLEESSTAFEGGPTKMLT